MGKHSIETIEKIRAGNLGKKRSSETVERIRASQQGKKLSDATKAKISVALRGIKRSAETRNKIRIANQGKKYSDELKAKLSESHKGQKLSAETVAKVLKSRSWYKPSKKTKEKIRKTMTTPEAIARASYNCKSQKGKQSYPEKVLEQSLDARLYAFTGLNDRYRQRLAGLPSPDFIARNNSIKLMIMVDGCFFHGCALHDNSPAKWRKVKQDRDIRLTTIATSQGWTVLRFWEHEIYNNINSVVAKINKTRNRLLKNV